MSVVINGIGFFQNTNTIANDYTVPASSNAITAGPITVNTGITVTVDTGAVWTIV